MRTVCELQLADNQRDLVAPASFTVAEAAFESGLLRAIYLDDELVGVLYVELRREVPYIVRFMVDAAHQRRGIGREAVELVLAELAGDGWPEVEVSFAPVPHGAEAFWRSCGFEDTGRTRHGEPVFRRSLGS